MVQAVSQQVEAIPNAMCSTVLCAVLHLPTGTMDWCRAGHLPPCSCAGTKAELLDEDGRPAPRRRSRAAAAGPPPGARARRRRVLYTDGVIERRQESIDEGFERLRVVGADLADLDPEDFSDALLEALVPARGADRRRRPARHPLRRPGAST